MSTYPTAGLLRAIQLLFMLTAVSVPGASRSNDGRAGAFARWVALQSRRLNSRSFVLDIGVRQILLVNDVELSGAVLDVEPNDQGFIEGELKRSAMAFLAPRALTISHGEEWERRRGFNESVLASGDIEELRAPVLKAVSGEFGTRVGSVDEMRERMRAVMRRVVLGDTGKQETAIEIDQLMGVVRSPLRRILFGWRYRGRKRRFYEGLSGAYQSAVEPALAGRAQIGRAHV